jgi:ADP-ribose pyrophosphatase YjhB (NUDIX family)
MIMSGTLEQQIGTQKPPEQHSLGDSFNQWLNTNAPSLVPLVHKAEAEAADLAAAVHLPGLDLVGDSAQAAAKPETQGAAKVDQANTSAHVNAAVAGKGASPSLLTEIENVGIALGKGALNEIENHPLQLAETAAAGFVVGTAVAAGVTLAVGAGILAAPEVAIGGLALTGLTLAVGGYQAFEHRDAIIHNTEVVANPDAYSAADVARSRQNVQNFGGAALETGVGVVSGVAGGFAGNALAASITEALSPAAASASAVLPDAGTAVSGDAPVAGAPAVGASGDAAAGDAAPAATGVPEVKTVTASLADGRSASVTMKSGADGANQVAQVQMSDGTVLTRQGLTNHWVADGGGPGTTVWDGDIKVDDQNALKFVYKYEKAPSVVSVEARLPDGSKVALANADGSLSLPSSQVDAVSQRLQEAGAQSVSPLKLNLSPERLQLDGVTTGANVNTKYVVNLSDDEAAGVRQLAASNAAVKIVPGDTAVGPTAAAEPVEGTIGENAPGAYEYPAPMPDHTASMAVFTKGDDGNWKVLTGLREREPFAGRSALPGGFLDMSGGSVEAPADAAAREVVEETGIKTTNPALVRIGDALGRDTRNRIIDFQYAAVASPEDMAAMNPTDDLHDLKLLDVKQLLDDPNSLAFDHHEMLSAAYQHLLATQPK